MSRVHTERPQAPGRRGARTHAALARRLRRIEWVAATQAQLAGFDYDLDGFMQTVVERVLQVTEATGVIIELVEGEHMVYRAVSDDIRAHLDLRLARAGSLSGLCVALAQTLYCADAETDPRVDAAACRRVGVRSMVCVPLIRRGEAVGVLKAFSSQPDAFADDDTEMLDLLAKALATALAKQLAYEAMQVETEARRRLEISLRASEARANRIVEEAHHGIVGMDAEGHITAWNRAAVGIFGWSEAEALGAALADLIIPPKFRRQHVAGLKRFLATGQATVMNRQLELEARRKDGEVIPIEMAITAIPDVDGWRFTALLQDISERRAETELFENAFHHAPIGYALVDMDGRFVKINDAFCRIVDHDPQTLLGMTFQDITYAEDLDRDLSLLGRLTSGEIPRYQMDKRYLRRDGSQVWVNLSVSMVRHRDGAPKHYVAQVQDLTERMEVEARYKLMAENSTDMITITEDGVTTFVSGACEKMVGRTPDECLGLSPAEYVHPDDLPGLYEAFRRTAAGQAAQRVRWRGLNRSTGQTVWLESCPSLLDTGTGRLSFVDVVRDVTGQVAHEAELAQARTEAETAAAAKGEFLANMSHEIRTPLTAVIGFAGLLQEQPELGCEARRFADRISAGAQALLALINDILDFSKLEAGEVEIRPRPTDVAGMGREILGLFQIQAEAKGLTLDLAIDDAPADTVSVDPQALRQVLFNLIGNAVKFTDTGGVTLAVTHADGALQVTVSDTGPGLSAEQQAKLFQRFSQVDGSSTRKHGGTGLGLAICRALVAAMGGDIGVSSRLGAGAVFHLRVPAPLVQRPGAALAATALALELVDGARVLVADDNAVNRELVRAMLEGLGAEVTEAADGLDAVDTAASLPFDVILMDLRMPQLDGLAAVRRIRDTDGPNQYAPILAFSANDLAEAPSGFDGAISKPVTVEKLAAAVAAALQPEPFVAAEDAHVSRG